MRFNKRQMKESSVKVEENIRKVLESEHEIHVNRLGWITLKLMSVTFVLGTMVGAVITYLIAMERTR